MPQFSAMPNNRFAWLAIPIWVVVLAGCGRESARLPDFTELVAQVAPAVVNISVVAATEKPAPQARLGGSQKGSLEPFHRDPPPYWPAPPSLGSGFIISESGYILTSRHVVTSPGRIVVRLPDRRQLAAKVVGSDEYSDIALLKVDAHRLPTVAIGDVDALEVGAWVIAIGSPFGFETSVTAGIVSAKGRSLDQEQYIPFIQTDVAINPGNSGGPLFNMAGEVVGVNAQIYSRSGGFQGVSFAIPIDIAMQVAGQLREQGVVRHGWLGVRIQEVDVKLARAVGLARPSGALVSRVLPGSPADNAGFETGDLILEFAGQPVPTVAALPVLVGLTPPGANVQVVVLRQGERRALEVTLGALGEDAPPELQSTAPPSPNSGAQLPPNRGGRAPGLLVTKTGRETAWRILRGFGRNEPTSLSCKPASAISPSSRTSTMASPPWRIDSSRSATA